MRVPTILVGALLLANSPLYAKGEKSDLPPVTIEALLASPLPEAPRYAFDENGKIRTVDLFLKDFPVRTDCVQPRLGRSFSINVESQIVSCQNSENKLEFWKKSQDKPIFSLELSNNQGVVSISWSGNIAFILIQDSSISEPPADALTSQFDPGKTVSKLTIVDTSTGNFIAERELVGSVLEITPVYKNRVYYSSFDFTNNETIIRRLDISTDRDNQIYKTAGVFQTSRVAVSPDESHILFAVDRVNRRWDDYTNLLLIDTANGNEVAVLSGELAVSGWYGWSRNGSRAYFAVKHGGYDQIVSASMSGQIEYLTDDKVTIRRISASPVGDTLAYETQSLSGRKEIRSLSLTNERERVWHSSEGLETHFSLTEAKQVWWQADDGLKIAGFLFLPQAYDASKRYPVIVDIHGGGRGQKLVMAAPLTLSTASGTGEWYAWAALGYMVFVPDYRSSGAYGPLHPSISACCNDGIVKRDAADVLNGIDALIEQGLVDPDKVALLGHSAGGARAIELLGGSRHFAAAIVNEAVAPDPLFTFINSSHGRRTGSLVLKSLLSDVTPEAAPEELLRDTSMLSAYRSKTPTLVMVGNEEFGATQNLTGEFIFTLLRNEGVRSRLVRFPEDGHTYTTPSSSFRAFQEVRDWLSQNLP